MAIRMMLVPVRNSCIHAGRSTNAYLFLFEPAEALRSSRLKNKNAPTERSGIHVDLRSPDLNDRERQLLASVQVKMCNIHATIVVTVLAMVAACSTGGASAQENPQRLGSVLRQLDPSVADTTQLALLISACESWSTSNNAFPYMQRLDSLSNKLLSDSDPAIHERAVHARGAFHFFTGYHAKFARNFPLALRSFHSAINEFASIGAQGALAETYDALGILFRAVGDHGQAFTAFREERRIATALQRPHINTQALVHLAACTADRGDFRTAGLFLDSCSAGGPADSSSVLNERARIAMLQGDKVATIKLLHESLDRARRSTNPWDQLPALAPLARAHYAMDEDADGLLTALECERVGKEIGDQTALCTCMVLVGEGEHRAGGTEKAEHTWLDALQLAREMGNTGSARELGDEGSVLHITALLGKLYRGQGRVSDALSMSDEWVPRTITANVRPRRNAVIGFSQGAVDRQLGACE